MERRHRRSVRLDAYDHAQPGAYFVTIVTHQRLCLFGEIVDREARLSPLGEIVEREWRRTAEIRSEIELGAFVVMPNHLHGIVVISADASSHAPQVGATGGSPLGPRGPAPKSLGALVAGFKASATKQINLLRATPNVPVWQRNYYEHVIRGQEDWERIHRYIDSNPTQWARDEENPQREL